MKEALAGMEALVIGRGLPTPGSGVVVAVSGGRDSMVLLRLLDRWRARQGWRLVVAHFNHQLRGADADADQAFVAAAAAAGGLEFVAGTADVTASQDPGESWESAARRLRHGFLAQTARERGCAWVALGHHGGDQAELFLLRLLRGAGAAGLGGMRESGPSPADPSVQLVRPLLGCPSEDVAMLAEAWGVAFRVDATNADPAFYRNRVRHELMPLLRARFQPASERVLVREQTLLRDQAEFLAGVALDWLQSRASGASPEFSDLPVAVQREVIRIQAERLSLSLGFEWVEALRGHPGVAIQVTGGRRVVLDAAGRLCTPTLEAFERGEFREDCKDVLIQGGEGTVPFGGGTVMWRIVRSAAGAFTGSSDVGAECFDADRVGGRVRLRHWRPGDRFQPIGLEGLAKIQDLFTNARVPATERRGRVVAESESGEVFWVEGLRIGECAKVTASTANRLVWRWERISLP